MDDFTKGLMEADAEFPESWDPKPGDCIVGIVEGYETNVGRYGSTICKIRSEADHTIKAVWISTVVLANKFQGLRPLKGERVGIKYLGKHPTKSYSQWVVQVERSEDDLPDFTAGSLEDIIPADGLPF